MRLTGPEHAHKLLMLLHRLLNTQNPHFPQLLVQRPSSQSALRHVRPVQAVHAVGAHHPALFRHDPHLAARGQRGVHRVVPSHLVQRRAEPVDQDRDAVKAHFATLGVEVKVHVVRLGGDGGVGLAREDHVALESVFDG